MSPPVASTDSAKPTLTASCGSISTSAITDVASAGTTDLVRPVSKASMPMPPINAARSTDGCGPTRITRPSRVTVPPIAAVRGPNRRSTTTTIPHRIAKCDPETASR